MKKQRYIVEIEMPDGDFISAGWLKDIIQTDCDVEDESRKKVTVQETSLPSNLGEEAEFDKMFEDFCDQHPDGLTLNECAEFFYDKGKQSGAEWMASRRSNEIFK